MDEISQQINSGTDPVTALTDSAQSRLRPVMMASLTTILGMIPLLTDPMFGSLSASIMGGLLFRYANYAIVYPCALCTFLPYKKVEQWKKTNRLILSLLVLCQGILAQEYLTLQQCREMALEQNKQLAASVYQIEYADILQQAIKRASFPTFKLNGRGLLQHQ